ncbi:MAG TPA: DegT/DnrJ/EryC1/StrS family aminotransferase, partial [Paludibacter sp.]|nr:DegT/DnrJ/EryC1/StrS family aminotransferase [Paludibacter sp.]
QKIADKYNLKVIYDAAHAFGVRKNGLSVLNYGDLSVLSFHAIKVFSTIEGGAVICHSAEMKNRLDNIKNFGIISETEVTEPGINAKLNELQSAFGLMQLKYVNQSIDKRKELVLIYRSQLENIPGVKYFDDCENITPNYSYFPILIDEKKYGSSRNSLYEKLKMHDIYSRRYFYPLISDFEPYNKLPGSEISNIPVATRIAQQILCLPLYTELSELDVIRICSLIKN